MDGARFRPPGFRLLSFETALRRIADVDLPRDVEGAQAMLEAVRRLARAVLETDGEPLGEPSIEGFAQSGFARGERL